VGDFLLGELLDLLVLPVLPGDLGQLDGRHVVGCHHVDESFVGVLTFD
jgi:hypothetical protein